MSSVSQVSSSRERELERIAYDIAKELFRGLDIPTEEEGEEEEKKGSISNSNLRNMLEAAREAREKGSWDIFKLKVIYVARDAKRDKPLYKFVERLLKLISEKAKDEYTKVLLAEKVLIASIYMFSALRKGFRSIVYEGGR